MTQKRIDAFLTIADEELAAAEKLHVVLPRQAQYFLQQTVEKLVRAVLESEDVVAGAGHNITMLAGMLPVAHALGKIFFEFEHLSTASTKYRYPTSGGAIQSIKAPEVARTLSEVKNLREEVRAFLSKARRA